jgi:hypothetical protein
MTPCATSRLRLLCEVARMSTVVRQCSFLAVALAAMVEPAPSAPSRDVLVAGVAGWAAFRLFTRSSSVAAVAGDVAWTVVVGIATPILAASQFPDSLSVPQAVVGVSLASLAVQIRTTWSLTVLTAGVAAYAWGISALVGWNHAVLLRELLPIIGGWLIAVVLHRAIRGVADAADRAHHDRLEAEVATGIADARREADREQLALLHDTAAATLLLVADEGRVPAERLAAQATRDLALLNGPPLQDPSEPVDVIALLREETAFVGVPVQLTGVDHLWIEGELGRTLCAAAREALTNVDRHAVANSANVYVGRERLAVTDDGRGFAGTTGGHGIQQSIIARMRRVGGDARIESIPGVGTSVELRWREGPDTVEPVDASDDTERLARGVASSFNVTLMASGLVLLVVGVLRGTTSGQHPWLQVVLAVAAACCTLAAAPRMLRETRWTAWVAGGVLAGLAVAQHESLVDTGIPTYADWSLGAFGFCLLPFLIRLPAVHGLTILSVLWTIPALIDLVRDPSPRTLVYIGLAVAAFFVPQAASCLFGGSVLDGLRRARREDQLRLRTETRDAIVEAMQSDRRRRYSDTVERLIPLLQIVSSGSPITGGLRRQARVECCRLRTLFEHSSPESVALTERVHTLIGKAEDRGVAVTAFVDGNLPLLTETATDYVLGQLDHALEHAHSWARIVLTSAHAEVDLSVVCDMAGGPDVEMRRSGIGSEVVVADDTIWVTLRAG